MDLISRFAAYMASRLAMDDQWITVHPGGKGPKANGKGDKKGTPVLLDNEGRVKAGMGGKFNGDKISEVKKSFMGPKTPRRFVPPPTDGQEEKVGKPRRIAKPSGTKPTTPKAKPPVGGKPVETDFQKKLRKLEKARDKAQQEYDAISAVTPEKWYGPKSDKYQEEHLQKMFPGCRVDMTDEDYIRVYRQGRDGRDVIVGGCARISAPWRTWSESDLDRAMKETRRSIKNLGNSDIRQVNRAYLEELKEFKKQMKPYFSHGNDVEEARKNLQAAKDDITYANTAERRKTLTFGGVSASSSISAKIPKDRIDEYDALVNNNAPETVKRFIADRIAAVSVGSTSHHGTAHAKGDVIFYDVNTPRGPHTFFHEAGHAMDYDPQTGKYRSGTWRGGKFSKSLDADVKNIIEAREKDLANLSAKQYAAKYGVNASTVSRTAITYPSMNDRVNVVLSLELRAMKCNVETSLSIADMILMSTKGKYGYGHDKAYAKKKEINQTTEAFAEMTDTYCVRPNEVEIIRKMFPTAMADYDEMVKEA